MSRQFSEDEARRIFARAAERQHTASPVEGSLSMDELQAIGREAGIDPAHIAAAVAEADTPPAPTWLGAPLRHRTVRHVGGAVSDAAWGRIVEHLRTMAPTADEVEEIGDRRMWTSNPAMPGYGARVMLVPDGDGTRLTVESARGPQDAFVYTMGGITGMMGGIGLLAWLAKGKASGLVMMLLMLAVFVVFAAGGIVSHRRRARSAPAETERLADTLARLAAPAVAPASRDRQPDADLAPRLDLDALGDAPDSDARARDARSRA